ncbi:hypothetical protein, partial [Mycobacterium intracellulare]|uniref:hypothetical protein n=1 Tax=Mycobacterium intracellulare TaxID=1767 RepID=UPI001F2DFB2C
TNSSGENVMVEEYPEALAELIVRALQWGRRSFPVPEDEELAEQALQDLWNLVDELSEEFRLALAATGVSARFEDDVKRRALGVVNVDLQGLSEPFDSKTHSIN